MRIAMLSYHTCPLATLGGKDTGGMNVYVRELTRHLGAQGVQVDVFTRSQDEHVPHVLHDLGYGNRVVHVPAGPEVPLSREELTSHLPQFVQGIRDFSASKDLRYDLIHSHYWMSGIAARDLKTAWDVPVVHMFHTLGLMKARVARPTEEPEGEYRLKGERAVIELSDRIVAATPAELAQLQWLYKVDQCKIAVIPPGVDISHFYPIPPDEAREVIGVPNCEPQIGQMLLFVGRIEPLKGVDILIQALAILRERGIRVCLIVIGGDPDITREARNEELIRLKAMSEQIGLKDLVVFLGKRSQDTLPYYYSAAQAVVVPSHYESFGMVALEAMACGTPVVASQVGGLAFLVQDGVTGYTVEVDDPQALAIRLSLILQDEGQRRKMGEQALRVARQYAWEVIAGRVIQLYDDVLAGGPCAESA